MSSPLRPLGRAWQPLLDAAVEELVRGGLELGALWPEAADREGALARLGSLLDLVVTWNARIDLTAARSERELVDLYLADALVIAAHAARACSADEPERWVDVGSGAGAPGLALSLLWPGPELTLVEPRQKRVAFLRQASGRFTTPAAAGRRVRIVEGRSSAVSTGAHDVALSRATFAPEEWLREGARLARRSVWVLLARSAPPRLDGWRLAPPLEYAWPLTQVRRQALEFLRE